MFIYPHRKAGIARCPADVRPHRLRSRSSADHSDISDYHYSKEMILNFFLIF